jgi:hypothetical protein
MTRWSAITPTRGRRSALAYGSRSATAAEETTPTDSYTTSGDATRPSRVGGLRAPAGTWLQRPVRTSSKGCGARSSRRFTLAPLLLYKTDNSPRVRNGYTSLGTHGHARVLRTHLKGPICRRNVIADARLWTPVPVG